MPRGVGVVRSAGERRKHTLGGHRRGRKQASRQTRELIVSLKLGVAGPTRLEVATSGVTGRRERQPNAADPENWGRLSLLVAVQCRP